MAYSHHFTRCTLFFTIAWLAHATPWTTFEGPSHAVKYCAIGDLYDPGLPAKPGCAQVLNTALSVDDEGNYLVIWEEAEHLLVAGGPLQPHAVKYRYIDGATTAYLTSETVLTSGSVAGELHSPSISFVPDSAGGRFSISRRVVASPSTGRVHEECRVYDPTTPLSITCGRRIDPGPVQALCDACDNGTSHLFYDPWAGRLRWVFTYQHPEGSVHEYFDELYGTSIDADAAGWDSSYLVAWHGDHGFAGTCADLASNDYSPPEPEAACFSFPTSGAPGSWSPPFGHAQHHGHLSRRNEERGLILVDMDWSVDGPNTVKAHFEQTGGTLASMLLPSAPAGNLHGAAEGLGTVAEDAFFHAAWKQKSHAIATFHNTVMHRLCTGTQAECALGLGAGHWIPDAISAWPAEVYQVNLSDGTEGQRKARKVEPVGIVSTPPVGPGTVGAVLVAFEVKDLLETTGDATRGNFTTILVASACLNDPSTPGPLTWTWSQPDPLVVEGDERGFGSRTFDNLVVDPVNERVVLSWIAEDQEHDELRPVESYELRWAYTHFRNCPA